MSEIKHSFRIMIIDIDEDKVVVDEFADAIVGGFVKSGSTPKDIEKSEICACKCSFIVGIGAVEAAEKAIMTQKRQVVKSFMEKATPEMMKECFGGEELEDDTAE